MSDELSNFGDNASASVNRGAQHGETLGIQGIYHVVCRDKKGNIKWEDDAPNLVTAAGKQSLFDFYFGATGTAGGTASGANYLGLIGYTGTLVTAGSFVVGATYQIASVGTTTFTAIGAAANTIGTVFVATGVGSGTGTANLIGTFLAADTMVTHAGWVEVGLANAPTYTGNRQSITWTAATSSGTSPSNVTTKTGSTVTFAITSSGSVGGCFINGGASASATKDTTTGVLYSAGAFTGGYKTVSNGDSLTVTYSTTATS